MTKSELYASQLLKLSDASLNLEDYLINAHDLESILPQQRRFELIYKQASQKHETYFSTFDDWVAQIPPWLSAFNAYRSNHEHTNSNLWIEYSILSSPPDRITCITPQFVEAVQTYLSPKAKVDYLVYLLTTYITYNGYGRSDKKPLLAKELLEDVAALELTKEESSNIGLSKKSMYLASISEKQSLRLIKQWYNLPPSVIELYKHLLPYPGNRQDASKWWIGLIKNNTAKIHDAPHSVELPDFY